MIRGPRWIRELPEMPKVTKIAKSHIAVIAAIGKPLKHGGTEEAEGARSLSGLKRDSAAAELTL
jgi:hypothetical protein